MINRYRPPSYIVGTEIPLTTHVRVYMVSVVFYNTINSQALPWVAVLSQVSYVVPCTRKV